jgi:hypothetical protein
MSLSGAMGVSMERGKLISVGVKGSVNQYWVGRQYRLMVKK